MHRKDQSITSIGSALFLNIEIDSNNFVDNMISHDNQSVS